ncbi:MAG: SRPBCC domain-containing protein [Chloroflexi bacterium]|nr:SRPBCC domain-containing protein [Chloroflexota bacterium]
MNPTAAVMRRVLRGSRDQVFAAWSDPHLMAQWFFVEPGWCAQVENEFRVGGSYTIEMRTGNDALFVIFGEYREIVRDSKIVFTWNSPLVQNTLVTIELRALGAQTELTLTHELFPDAAARERDAGGWQGCLDNLARFLEIRYGV